MKYSNEFPDFDYDYKALLAELGQDWEDASWKNDSCPSAQICMDKELDHRYTLWFDYNDPDKSEFPLWRKEGKISKFDLTDADGTEILSTNNWKEMKSAILVTKIHQKYYDLECENQYIERQRDA